MKLIKYKSDSQGLDSVKERKTEFGKDRDIHLLEECNTLWESLRPFRRSYARALRFTYGDQWGEDIVVRGKKMKERDYVARQGNVALQTNQIKKVVNTIAGVWTKQKNEPVCYARDNDEQRYGNLMTAVLQANWELNKMPVLMEMSLKTAYIGGLIAARECYTRRFNRDDAWTDIVNPNYLFFSSPMKDPRFADLTLIGQIHDLSFNELCSAFAMDAADYKTLREWYYNEASPLRQHDLVDATDRNNPKGMSFYTPSDSKLCRVFEVWTKERRPRYHVWDKNNGEFYDIEVDDKEALATIEEENKARRKMAPSDWKEEDIPLIEKTWFIDTFWFYRYLTPSGYILMEGESEEPDRGHPYTLMAIPFTNGLISSPANDAIDMNIAINRILTLDDWIRRTGAKGVTFVPRNIIPDDMDYETFADQWTSIDGIVYYQPRKDGSEPKTFYGQTGTLNTSELVRLMSDLLEGGVSVSGALQGKTPYSGTSGALYNLQTENSSTPLATLLEEFNNLFVESVAVKKAKYIKSKYTAERYESIAGKIDFDMGQMHLDETGDVEYDLSIKQSTQTPVFRAASEDWLMGLYQMSAPTGQMTLDDYLATSSNPLAKELLQRIQARQQEMMQAQGMAPPEVGANYDEKRRTLLGRQEGNA